LRSDKGVQDYVRSFAKEDNSTICRNMHIGLQAYSKENPTVDIINVLKPNGYSMHQQF
jgi:hypothetical protein